MKILFVSYYGWLFGGGETYLFALKDALEKRGHDVRILSSDYGKETHKIKSDYTFTTSKTKIGWVVNSLFSIKSLTSLRKILKEFNPDIVHISSVSNEVSPSITFALKHYPTIMPIMSRFTFSPDKRLPWKSKPYAYINTLTRRLLLHNINLYTTVSASTRESIPKNKQPLEILHVGIKLLPYAPLEYYNNILFSGRIVREKGLGVLIDAMREIVKVNPSIELCVIGNGPELEKYKQSVEIYRLQGNVKFLGYIDNQKIGDYIIKTTLVVVPSIYEEPFGLSGIEAMSIGRPVVGSSIGGIPEWLNERGGKLVSPNNPAELSKTIIELLSNKENLIRISKSAHIEAQKYSIDKRVKEIEKVYLALLQNN
jgi:glycosyltransferase involved in cell wall biosynthesis